MIWEAVQLQLSARPTILDLSFSRIKYPDSATVEELIPEFTNTISIDEDQLRFTVVASCTIELTEDDYRGDKSAEICQWLSISCEVQIEDTIKSFAVTDIHPYTKERRSIPSTGIAASKSIVPLIRKCDLDNEATLFLQKYYPAALTEVVPVPIEEIITEVMHLELIQGKCLSESLSINIKTGIETAWTAIKEFFTTVVTAISEFLTNAWNSIHRTEKTGK